MPCPFPLRLRRAALAVAAVLGLAAGAHAAGTLTPVGSPDAPIEIRGHHVRAVLNNGFARTEVTQTFYNPNPMDLEGIYAFPLPESASLSEVVIASGETEIHGEVIARDEAERVYETERQRGRDAGLATKEGFQTFEFRVAPIRAGSETRLRFVYYQPLEIDTGVGRYLYPLEDGGTDEVAKRFWLRHEKVDGELSVEVELVSAWPVTDVRVPGFESEAVVAPAGEGRTTVRLARADAALDRDFVLYYKLAEELPGRVELIPYRPDPAKPGTFMMVVTPGVDLAPLSGGADTAFVLDVSGSMAGKIGTLGDGVTRALAELAPHDRFRVVTFNDRARELTPGWVAATPEAVAEWSSRVGALRAGGSTNLHEGLSLGLDRLDADRATSVVLVTDAVTNTGVVEPRAFHELMKRHDVRVFGFLLGNGANWPLMRIVAETSGGFYAPISNADDVLGQLLLARSKVTHEALHDAELTIRGVRTSETTGALVPKVYRGQQLVLFGRYEEAGTATVRLDAALTGEDRHYTTTFDFPGTATDHPEIERLWALARIEEIQRLADTGLADGAEARAAVRDLGVAYQLVTDETSMVVLSDAAFEEHGIERRNRTRTALEHAAQARRAAAPVRDHRVDRKRPMFDLPAPGIGGGAIDPLSGALALGLGALAMRGVRGRRGRS